MLLRVWMSVYFLKLNPWNISVKLILFILFPKCINMLHLHLSVFYYELELYGKISYYNIFIKSHTFNNFSLTYFFLLSTWTFSNIISFLKFYLVYDHSYFLFHFMCFLLNVTLLNIRGDLSLPIDNSDILNLIHNVTSHFCS